MTTTTTEKNRIRIPKMKISDCEECKVNPWKYTCPGCSIRSCGVDCVKAHKNRTGCTGKRKATDFVPISEFDDNLLLSDYNMLEETKRVAESAQRMRHELVKHQYKLPFMLRSLNGAALSRRTQILFLPNGMSKREKNQSRYSIETKCISWTIEWRFNSTDVVLTDHRVSEDTILCSVIENHLKPGPWKNKLKPFCDVDLNSLRLFIRKNPKGPKGVFKELDIKAPLRKQLTQVAVLEYPVIHVYLPSQSYDFIFYRDDDFNHRKTTPNPNASLCDGQETTPSTNASLWDGQGSANGIPFREEELEDEDDINSVEPKVLDLFKQRYDNPYQRVSKCSKVEGGFTDNSHPYVGPTKQGDAGDMEFDKELVDAYSDVFPEMKPGDFFNFEFEIAEGLDSVDNSNLQNLATDSPEINSGEDYFDIDGLEEGEIAE